jgi:branched-chain amino acid aminotransferase
MTGIVPFDQRDGFIWIDGNFVPWREATVHVCTHALHYGSCVFEGERVYNNKIFKGLEHTQRLFKSAELLGMTIPYTIEQIEEAKRKTVDKQGFTDAYIRAFAWRGSEMMGIAAQHNTIHVGIAVWQWPSYFDPAQKLKGLRLDIAPWKRPSPETIPSAAKAAGLYMICTLSKHIAENKGYADALMLDYQGRVAEATGANVFFIKEGVIHTPAPECFLNGITRQTVIAMARAKGIVVVERDIFPSELETFEQCFLTGTAAEVTPVSEIGSYTFEVGDLVKDIMTSYEALVRS